MRPLAAIAVRSTRRGEGGLPVSPELLWHGYLSPIYYNMWNFNHLYFCLLNPRFQHARACKSRASLRLVFRLMSYHANTLEAPRASLARLLRLPLLFPFQSLYRPSISLPLRFGIRVKLTPGLVDYVRHCGTEK